jgi:hypothetical protein
VTSWAVGRGEEHLLAAGTGDLVNPVEELLAVVNPLELPDRLAAHEREQAVDVGLEGERRPAARAAAGGDQGVERRLVEGSHRLSSITVLSGGSRREKMRQARAIAC